VTDKAFRFRRVQCILPHPGTVQLSVPRRLESGTHRHLSHGLERSGPAAAGRSGLGSACRTAHSHAHSSGRRMPRPAWLERRCQLLGQLGPWGGGIPGNAGPAGGVPSGAPAPAAYHARIGQSSLPRRQPTTRTGSHRVYASSAASHPRPEPYLRGGDGRQNGRPERGVLTAQVTELLHQVLTGVAADEPLLPNGAVMCSPGRGPGVARRLLTTRCTIGLGAG
jgi:hypothetical protein